MHITTRPEKTTTSNNAKVAPHHVDGMQENGKDEMESTNGRPWFHLGIEEYKEREIDRHTDPGVGVLRGKKDRDDCRKFKKTTLKNAKP